jgi:cytoskeletal protein RodZ
MNINRNNYEEYFLLYADNELSKAERKMVEIFVKENPEFREDFCMIKLTINIPDDEIRLEDKSFLFKNESSFFINKTNYEEGFVQYHDKELSEKSKLETESFLAQYPELKSEFELIGKAKLSPDTSIVYPGKQELYRKEKSGKVITFMWWRYAAAAVLIGFGIWVAAPYFNNPASNHPVGAGISETNNTTPSTEVVLPKDAEPITHRVAAASVNEKSGDKATDESHLLRTVTMQKDKITKNEVAKNTVNITTPSLTQNIKELKKEPVEVIALKASDEKNDQGKDGFDKAIAMQAKSPVEKTESEVKPNYAHTVAYNETSSNNNYIFYDIPAEEFKKSKVGGFLKKVKRIVERTNPITRLLEGNDEPVVANKF